MKSFFLRENQSLFKNEILEKPKTAESSICSKEVHVYMPTGCHCAMLEGRLAKSVIIPQITIVKTLPINRVISELEKKEFKQCVIHAFGVQDDVIGFSFRYRSFADSYTSYDGAGLQSGNAAVQIDLTKWEIKDS